MKQSPYYNIVIDEETELLLRTIWGMALQHEFYKEILRTAKLTEAEQKFATKMKEITQKMMQKNQ